MIPSTNVSSMFTNRMPSAAIKILQQVAEPQAMAWATGTSGSLSQVKIQIVVSEFKWLTNWVKFVQSSTLLPSRTVIVQLSFKSTSRSPFWYLNASSTSAPSQCWHLSMVAWKGTCTVIATLELLARRLTFPILPVDTCIWLMTQFSKTVRSMANMKMETNFQSTISRGTSIWISRAATSASCATCSPKSNGWSLTRSGRLWTRLTREDWVTRSRFSDTISWLMRTSKSTWLKLILIRR